MLIDVLLPRGGSKDSVITEALVTRVHDGDTESQEQGNVRLLGIDAPELRQTPWGITARDWLSGRINGKHVKLIADPKAGLVDKYGRMLRWISLDGVIVNQEIVVLGLAVPYMIDHVNPIQGIAIERACDVARTEKRGVWSDPTFILPSVFRKQNVRSI